MAECGRMPVRDEIPVRDGMTGWSAACTDRERVKGKAVSEVVYNRIVMLRAERGVTRRQLADALGVHYQTIGYLERGEYSPSLYLALRIAGYFEIPLEVIFSTVPFPRLGSSKGSASA
jgi:putative transcriptional regulator